MPGRGLRAALHKAGERVWPVRTKGDGPVLVCSAARKPGALRAGRVAKGEDACGKRPPAQDRRGRGDHRISHDVLCTGARQHVLVNTNDPRDCCECEKLQLTQCAAGDALVYVAYLVTCECRLTPRTCPAQPVCLYPTCSSSNIVGTGHVAQALQDSHAA